MQIKSRRDFVAGLLFIVAGVAFAWGATGLSLGSSARPGPGYFPLVLGILLAVIGVLVTFKALTIEAHGGDRIGPIAWRPLLAILGGVLLFGFLLPRAGLLLAVPLLVVAARLAGGGGDWKEGLLLAALLTLGSWLVFVKGLSLPLPLWPAAGTV